MTLGNKFEEQDICCRVLFSGNKII